MKKKALVMAVGVLMLIGCRQPAPKGLMVGVDASLSARRDLGAYGMFVMALSQQLEPGVDRLTLYRVERKTEEFRDSLFDGDTEALLRSIRQAVKPLPQRTWTLPAAFWQEVATRARTTKQPLAICLLSDGDNDDFTTASEQVMRAAANSLAACPQVRSVTIAGARPESWHHLRRVFAPLGERFTLIAPPDLTPEQAQALLTH
jgi:hypothetical protein